MTPETYKRICSRFPKGVTVVTARRPDGLPIGMTVSAFTGVSLAPPTVLICVRSASQVAPAFLQAEHFCVNVLSESQREISQQFASRDFEQRFCGVRWNEGLYAVPVLPDTLGYFVCERGDIVLNGDHYVIFGEVIQGGYSDVSYPLVYWASEYQSLVPPPK
jgi:flavin reductase (DIM6/NTAB) family NADH-FMN oxidoreductase RutF